MTDAISTVRVDYVSTGADKLAADYARVAAAERGLASSSESVVRETDTLTGSILSVQKALDSYTRAHDPLSRAMADLARGERLVSAARAQGLEVTEAHIRGLDTARNRVAALKDGLDSQSASFQAVARGTDEVSQSYFSAQKALDAYTRAHDPLSQALADLATGERLVAAAQAEGIDVTEAHSRGLEAAQKRVSALKSELDGDPIARSVASARKALDDYTRAHDPLSHAMADLASGERLVMAARAQGVDVTEAHTRGLEAARKRVAELKDGLDSHSTAVGFNRMQVMEATHVLKAFADEVMAGQSPLRALQVEGGRIAQIFAEGQGGVAGTLKATGALVTRLATGWVGLGVATAAVIGVSGAVALSYEASQERMTRALEGTGRRAGLTVQQLDAVAKAGSRAGNLGLGEARGLAGGFAQAGLDGVSTTALLGSTARFARFTGSDTGEAGKALAAAFADPARGAVELDRSLGFLNDRLGHTIQDYEASGQHAAAQRVLLDAYSAALKSTTDSAWAAGEALREVKRWGGSLIDRAALAVLGGERRPEEDLASYRAMLPHTFDSPLAVGNLSRTYVQAQIDRLQHQVDARIDPTAAKRDAEANDLSKQAGPLIRSLLPDLVRTETATNSLGLLRQALSDPAVLDRLSVSPERARQAYGDLAVTSANADPARRAAQDYELQRAAADAFSTAERAAVDARRAELAVLRETGDVARAAEAAERARNLVIEAANKAARDRLEMARQDAGLVGLTPYQRGRQEIVNQFEGYGGILAKDAASRSDLSEAMRPVADDLKRALGEVAAGRWRSRTPRPAAGRCCSTGTPGSSAPGPTTFRRCCAASSAPKAPCGTRRRPGPAWWCSTPPPWCRSP